MYPSDPESMTTVACLPVGSSLLDRSDEEVLQKRIPTAEKASGGLWHVNGGGCILI